MFQKPWRRARLWSALFGKPRLFFASSISSSGWQNLSKRSQMDAGPWDLNLQVQGRMLSGRHLPFHTFVLERKCLALPQRPALSKGSKVSVTSVDPKAGTFQVRMVCQWAFRILAELGRVPQSFPSAGTTEELTIQTTTLRSFTGEFLGSAFLVSALRSRKAGTWLQWHVAAYSGQTLKQ